MFFACFLKKALRNVLIRAVMVFPVGFPSFVVSYRDTCILSEAFLQVGSPTISNVAIYCRATSTYEFTYDSRRLPQYLCCDWHSKP